MTNHTQLERYKKLLTFLDENFKEDIDIEKVEKVCHYSYRNINRIFAALHQETIGKYIKRLRLEKAAQYLDYTKMGVSEIAYEVGFEDRAVFSKAFKNKYGCSPAAFRTGRMAKHTIIQESLLSEAGNERQKLQFEIEYLPDFQFLFLEYRGNYQNLEGVEKAWEQLIDYATQKEVLSNRSFFMSEIVDDMEISDKINSRYNMAIILEHPLGFEPEGLFRIKKHQRQKYAKFTHKGSVQSCLDFYTKIYAFWILDVGLELADLPVLESYPNYNASIHSDEWLTEIYIPIG